MVHRIFFKTMYIWQVSAVNFNISEVSLRRGWGGGLSQNKTSFVFWTSSNFWDDPLAIIIRKLWQKQHFKLLNLWLQPLTFWPHKQNMCTIPLRSSPNQVWWRSPAILFGGYVRLRYLAGVLESLTFCQQSPGVPKIVHGVLFVAFWSLRVLKFLSGRSLESLTEKISGFRSP
jgi:hypothetical protein